MPCRSICNLSRKRGRRRLTIFMTILPEVAVVTVYVVSVISLIEFVPKLTGTVQQLYVKARVSVQLAVFISRVYIERSTAVYSLLMAGVNISCTMTLNSTSVTNPSPDNCAVCLPSSDIITTFNINYTVCRQMASEQLLKTIEASDVALSGLMTSSDVTSSTQGDIISNLMQLVNDVMTNINITRENLLATLSRNHEIIIAKTVDEVTNAYTTEIRKISVGLKTYMFGDVAGMRLMVSGGEIFSRLYALDTLQQAQASDENLYLNGLVFLLPGNMTSACVTNCTIICSCDNRRAYMVENESRREADLRESFLFDSGLEDTYNTALLKTGVSTSVKSKFDTVFETILYDGLANMTRSTNSGSNTSDCGNGTSSLTEWTSIQIGYRAVFDILRSQILTDLTNDLDRVWSSYVGQILFHSLAALVTLPLALLIWSNVQLTLYTMRSYARVSRLQAADLKIEQEKVDILLSEMLPKSVAKQLMSGDHVRAEEFENATIFFSDICNFRETQADREIMEMLNVLNSIFTLLDSHIDRYDVYKVETIGDIYMVASGVPTRNGDRHVTEIANMALDILNAADRFQMPDNTKLTLRIGVNTGRCVAGVVGNKMTRYCLFGDTVNVASRMQSNGLPCKIHVTQSTYTALSETKLYSLQYRGTMLIKGKGAMQTYWLCGRINNEDDLNFLIRRSRPPSNVSFVSAKETVSIQEIP